MTFNYTGLRDNTAEPLLTRFGKSATLTTATTAGGDPWNPTPGAATTQTVTVVQTQFTERDRARTLIEEGDVMFLVSTEGDPSVDLAQTLTVDGVTYQVVEVMPLRPGPVTMLYKLHARK